ncbi:MAG TPA: hypothetical protein VKY57_00660 [Chitinispirillaceae bacterium]|nr:hypothetical protein [Chitinispirillaceae bacterium]
MKHLTTFCLFFILYGLLYSSDLQIKNSVTVEIRKNATDSTRTNIDNAFIRGETRFFKENNNNTFSAMVHLRFQTNFEMDTAAVWLRQAFFNVKLQSVNLSAGRWYEKYTPGVYFGRYLFGADRYGNGSISTDYTVLDGLRMKLSLPFLSNTNFSLALLPQESNFENLYAMFLISANFFDPLEINTGINLKALSENGTERDHRLIISGAYQIISDLEIFLEYGITSLTDIRDNSWIMFGTEFPSGKILDQLRLEFEYTKDRLNDLSDLAWIIAIQKEWQNLTFYLNTGSDPAYLRSGDIDKIGFAFRMSLSF